MPDYSLALALDLRSYGMNSPRSAQSRAGILGPSDLGFCRQKATLKTKGVAESDEKSISAAQIGTAIHAYAALAFAAAHPDWIIEDRKVTTTFPSGAEISGTPDIIATDWNALIDIKTTDGFEWVKRNGTSLNHRYQRHTYALGALQAGLLVDTEDNPLMVGNLYIDRSGKERDPYFVMERFDPTLTDEVDSWIQDVIYAVKTGEDASRDIVSTICDKICEFYTVCRGGLPVEEGQILINDDDTKAAIRMYVDGKNLASEGEKLKREAKTLLYGINGTDGEWQVRWVTINPSFIEGYERSGSERLDVVPVKK